MEAIFEVLIIVGIIAFGIIGQIRKAAARNPGNTGNQPYPVSVPDTEEDYYPEMAFDSPPPTLTVQQFKSRQKKSIRIPTKPEEKGRSPLQETENDIREFDIYSPDEVRKGIIWSEILSRKY